MEFHYFMTEMYKIALVLWLKILQRENRVAQAAWEHPTSNQDKNILALKNQWDLGLNSSTACEGSI